MGVNRIVLTSGTVWIDLDAYASQIALYELMALDGEEVFVHLDVTKQISLTPTLLSWSYDTRRNIDAIHDDDELILVDVSGKLYIRDTCGYNLDRVTKIYDHHMLDSQYRYDKIGDTAIIEPIGACATLLVEKALQDERLEQLSDTALKLLYTAILSNTLYFKAQVTTQRDMDAAHYLHDVISYKKLLPVSWEQDYFQEVETYIWQDSVSALHNDTKPEAHIADHICVIGQLELRDARAFIEQKKDVITFVMHSYENPYRFFTAPSISEGKTYLMTDNEEIYSWLCQIVNLHDCGGYYVSEGLVLRKDWNKLLDDLLLKKH